MNANRDVAKDLKRTTSLALNPAAMMSLEVLALIPNKSAPVIAKTAPTVGLRCFTRILSTLAVLSSLG
jgi:hypothetical protein